MRKMQRIIALMLVLMLSPLLPAQATEEDGIAWELQDTWPGAENTDEYVENLDAYTEQPQNVNIYDADLLIGYVAKTGAIINPVLCNDWDLVNINQLVFESLVTLDSEMKPSPMLADNWKHEGKQWTFTLRKGIQFHNGAELTAMDVVLSYEQYVQAGNANPYFARLDLLISSMQALDNYTLLVNAKYNGYLTLYAMDFPIIQLATLGDTIPRGTGPFWYTQYDTDRAIRIEANPLWWKKQPTLHSITAVRYNDVGEAIEALHTREIEMLSTRSPSAAINRKLSDLTSMDYSTMVYEMLVPNLSASSVMSDLNIRKAVMYAIDRSIIASNAYLDMAIQTEVPILPGSWLYESQSALYYYSPERALQYMHEAGWRDLTGNAKLNKLEGIQLKELTINIVTYNEPTNSIRENAVNLIASYLRNIGINVNIAVVSKEKALDYISNKSYDLALVGVTLSEVPALNKLLSTGGSLNLNKLANESLDALINSTATVATEAELKQAFSAIQMQIVDRLPIMGLLFRTGTVLSTRSLGGLTGIRGMNTFRGLEYLND